MCKIEALEGQEEYSERRYSRDGDWEAYGRYSRANDGGREQSYDDRGNSYRRGMYSSNDYSGHENNKKELLERMERMHGETNGREQEMIARAMEILKTV